MLDKRKGKRIWSSCLYELGAGWGYTSRWREGEDAKPLLGRQCSLSLQEVICTKAKHFPLIQALPHITVTPQVVPEPGGPGLGPPSDILSHSPATTHFHSFLHNRGHQKTELSTETGGFLVASGISFRLPEEHFTKKQVTRSLFSSLSWSHHLKHTRQVFSPLGFSLGPFFFFSFLSLIFLKGIWGWYAEMERGSFSVSSL